MRNLVVLAAACLTVTGLTVASESDASIRKPTNIVAQPLEPALQALSKDRNLQIVYRSEIVGDIQTPGATGQLTANETLKQLLNNTGLTYQYLDDHTVTIIPVQKTTSTTLLPEAGGMSPIRLAEAESKTDSAPAQTKSSDPKGVPEVQEIIVTATKREERLLDVPLSIGVVTAEDIDRRGYVSSEDYLRGIPGVAQASNGLYGESIVIRGLETSRQAQNSFAGTTVATYFGETPTTTSRGIGGSSNIDIKLVDIERVEVLRGPQGTAFGSSALGGAVRTIPVAPKLGRFEGKLAAGYSQTSGTGGDNNLIQGVGNFPLIQDKLALRVVAYRFDNSGYYRNVAGSDAAFQAAAVIPQGQEAYARDEDHVGTSRFIGGRAALLFQASDALKFTLNYLKQDIEQDGFPLQTAGDYEQTVLQVSPEHQFRGQTGATNDSDIEIANAMMEYDLNWANLLATYSYSDSGSTPAFAFTGGGNTLAGSALAVSKQRAHFGEIRLTTKFNGAWNFLGGLYAEDIDDEVNWSFLWSGDPSFQPFYYPHVRNLGVDETWRNSKQKAAFTEVSWKFLPRFTLTGGARYYDYDRDELRVTDGGFFVGNTNQPRQNNDSGTSFRGNLSFKPTDDTLAYASWSQGFRLGSTLPGLPPGSCDLNGDGIVDGTNLAIATTQKTDSDSANNYEIGTKFALLDRRVNLTADVFRIDWNNVPVLIVAPGSLPTNCGGLYIANGGEARSEGVEVQANFALTEAFSVDAGASYTRARLTRDAPALGFNFKTGQPIAAGNPLPTPEYNANLGLQYQFLMRGFTSFVRVDSTYVGSYYGTVTQDPRTEVGGYTTVNATTRLGLLNNLNADLFVRNLTNRDNFTFRGNGIAGAGQNYGYRLQPRTIGLQLNYSFN